MGALRPLLLLAVCGLAALASTACGSASREDGDAEVTALLAQLQAETDSVVRAALVRSGLQGFDPPEPGLSETYIRAPRRHAQVKRYYDAWLRVDAALTPTLDATMTDVANRLALGAGLGRRDSMAFRLEVASAIRNRRRELELRKMLADAAVGLYENPDRPASLSPSVAPPPPSREELDSISRERRRLTPEDRERVNESLERAAASRAAIMRRGNEIVVESRERTITQYRNRIERFQAELAEILARRAAGRFAPRESAE